MTGLRRKELGALRWDDVVLSDGGGFVLVRASIAKNARRGRIDLQPDAAAALAFWRSRSAGPLVFGSGGLPSVSVLKKDLDGAGLAFKDDLGRRLDFHSFRATLATMLAEARVPIPLAQQFMRHSDYKLTLQHYTDAGQFSPTAALQLFPRFQLSVAANFCNLLASPTGQNQSLPVPACPDHCSGQSVVNKEDCHALAPAVTSGQGGAQNSAGRIRTYNRSVNSRLLYH